MVSALLSLPPPLAVGWAPLLCPQGGPPPSGEEVPLGEEEEQGGVAGLHLEQALLCQGVLLAVLHLGDLLLRPNHQVQVVLPLVPHDFLGLVHLLQLMGRNIFLWQVSARGLSVF